MEERHKDVICAKPLDKVCMSQRLILGRCKGTLQTLSLSLSLKKMGIKKRVARAGNKLNCAVASPSSGNKKESHNGRGMLFKGVPDVGAHRPRGLI